MVLLSSNFTESIIFFVFVVLFQFIPAIIASEAIGNHPSVKTHSNNRDRCEIPMPGVHSDQCLRCASGFILPAHGGNICEGIPAESVRALQNCIRVGFFGECITCESGYAVLSSQGICVMTSQSLYGCAIFDDSESCLRPKMAFQLIASTNSSLVSQSKSIEYSFGTNCEIQLQGICFRCHHGFKLNAATQICEKFHEVLFNSYYSFFEGDQLKSRDFRLIALPSGVYPIIESCSSHFINVSSEQQSILSVDNNNNPLQNIRCAICTKGRVSNESQTACFKSPLELCARVKDSAPSICARCSDSRNYYLKVFVDFNDKNKTVSKCIPRKREKYEGCLEYQQNFDGCQVCRIPFVLVNNLCTIDLHLQLLAKIHENNEPATISNSSAILSSSIFAIPSNLIPNCAIYSDRIPQDQEFIRNPASPPPPPPPPQSTNFSNNSSNPVCVECDEGYILSDKSKSCILSEDLRCLQTDEQGFCLRCIIGTRVVHDSMKCPFQKVAYCQEFDYVGQQCVACNEGYFLSWNSDSKQFFCLVILNCRVSNGVDFFCMVCQNNHHLVSESESKMICVANTSIDGCFISDGKVDSCIICNRHFERNLFGKCVPFVPHNGITCNVQGFYIEDINLKYCKPHSENVKPNCVMLDPKRDRCLICIRPLYYLDESTGKCQQIFWCAVTAERERVCLKSVSKKGFIDALDAPSTQNLECYTNQRDPICVRYLFSGQIGVSQYLNAKGEIIVSNFDFNNPISFPNRITDNCFVIQKLSNEENTNVVNDSFKGDFKCVQCLSLFYPDAITGACEEIQIPNCVLSDGRNNQCLSCAITFTLDQNTGECIKQFNSINRCVEEENQKCQRCQSLFKPNYAGTVCTAILNPKCIESLGVDDSCECQSSDSKIHLQSESCELLFCEEIDFISMSCIKCAQGFHLSPFIPSRPLCYLDEQVFCEVLKDTMECEECISGYFRSPIKQKKQICAKITIPHCIKMIDLSFKCAKCQAKYFLTPKGNCVFIANCLTFDSRCTSCVHPMVPNEFGLCERIDRCLAISPDGTCSACESAYYLSTTKLQCLPIPNCAASSGGVSTLCDTCAASSTRIAYTCLPNIQVANCSSSEGAACLKCKNLFYVNERKTCSKLSYHSHCQISNGIENRCELCEQIPIAYKIIKSNMENSCQAIDNCMISNGIDSCVVCKRSFFLVKSQSSPQSPVTFECQLRTMRIPNCAYYDPAQDVCEECESLFYLSDSRLNCIAITELYPQNPCYFSDGISNSCLICQEIPFKFDRNIEQNRMPKSRLDHFENKFANCGFSQLGPLMSICSQNNYFFDTSRGVCTERSLQHSDHCVTYNDLSNGCLHCESGYYLIEESDLPYGSTCVPIPSAQIVENCEEYSVNSRTCVKCKQNAAIDIQEFYLDTLQNKCVNVIMKQCQYHKEDRYYSKGALRQDDACINGGISSESIKHIPFCERSVRVCETCKEQKCIECSNGFFVGDDFKCEKHMYLPNCKVYRQDVQNECESCEVGFSLFEQACLPIRDKNCDPKFYTSQYCSQCKEGYSFISPFHVCRTTEVKNCQKIFLRDSGLEQCRICKKGFSFNSHGICVNRPVDDQNCLVFKKDKSCEQCKPEYFISTHYGCLEKFSANSIQNCSVYSPDSHPDFYTCQKCETQYQVCYVDAKQVCNYVPGFIPRKKDSENVGEIDEYINIKGLDELKKQEEEKKKKQEQEQEHEKELNSSEKESNRNSAITISIVSVVLFVIIVVLIRYLFEKQARKKQMLQSQQQQTSQKLMVSVQLEQQEIEITQDVDEFQ